MDKEENSMYYERKNLKNFDRQKSRRKTACDSGRDSAGIRRRGGRKARGSCELVPGIWFWGDPGVSAAG